MEIHAERGIYIEAMVVKSIASIYMPQVLRVLYLYIFGICIDGIYIEARVAPRSHHTEVRTIGLSLMGRLRRC